MSSRNNGYWAGLGTQQTAQALDLTGGDTRQKIEYELKKLGPLVHKLHKKLSD